MKIIYASDIHESLKSLANLLKLTDADVYIIAGDLLYCAFNANQTAWEFAELQQMIFSWGKSRGLEGTREDMAHNILQDRFSSEAEKSQAQEFLAMAALAHRTMLKKYERIERIFTSSGKELIFTIPGNYDMDLSRTALKRWNLHKSSFQLNGLKISGYGGAKVFTPGIPEKLQVPFAEHFENKRLYSEPYLFFSQEKPDIILVHHPPYGQLDTLDTYGSIGSIGIRDFVDQSNVSIVLSGHMHEDWGGLFRDGKIFLNPSNFGRVVEIKRVKKGGYFIEFLLEGKDFVSGDLKQIENERIYDVEHYFKKEGKFRSVIMDLRRYRYLSGIRKRERHIQSIRNFNRIRGFFQKYETQATQARIQELLQFTRSLKKEGHEIAFHLLGSLNFGMAEAASDVDIVLYFRDPKIHVQDDEAYPIPNFVQQRIGWLKDQAINLSVCDCLNLTKIEETIHSEDAKSLLLQRFIFYDTICRCVNGQFIKQVENLFIQKGDFRLRVEQELEQYFRMIISTFRHAYSFKKYQMRLQEKGMKVPPYIQEVMWQYLKYRKEKKA
jgi:Icc-related predicted phosphoesterase